MRFPKQLASVAALLLAFSITAACSDDEGDAATDAGADTGTTDAVGDSDAGVSDDASANDAATDDVTTGALTDPTWRLTFVDIKRPIGGIGTILENLIAQDIDADLLHVLIQFRNFSADDLGGTFEVFGTAGEKVEGGYTWYPGAEPVEGDYKPGNLLDPATNSGEFCNADSIVCFENTENLGIIFPALEPGATEPLQIPVSELSLTGEIFEDGGEYVLFGLLSGAILAAEIEGLNVNVSGDVDGPTQPLAELLGDLTYPIGADDAEKTGWVLSAEIEAAVTTFIP